jgi:hypothetical protein
MHMGKRDKEQEGFVGGPTPHAEGAHGEKTHQHIIEQLQSGPPEPPEELVITKQRKKSAFEGKRRLVEDREQHDEAERNSERERLYKEHVKGRDRDGPSDNRGALHGVLGSREHRADYKVRGPDGLPIKPPDRP